MIRQITAPACAQQRPRARRTAWTALTALAAITFQFATATTAIAACWDTTHPDSRYIVNAGNGSVIDTNTGLAELKGSGSI